MRRNAFSLVELLIVIAIVGIVAAVAAPRFASASSSYRVRTGARRLAGDIQSTAELARTSSTTHGFLIGGQADGYSVYSFAGGVIARLDSTVLTDEPYNCQLWMRKTEEVKGLVYSGYGRTAEQTELAVVAGDVAVIVRIRANVAIPTVYDPTGWGAIKHYYRRVGGGNEFDPADLQIETRQPVDFADLQGQPQLP